MRFVHPVLHLTIVSNFVPGLWGSEIFEWLASETTESTAIVACIRTAVTKYSITVHLVACAAASAGGL